MDSDGQSYRRFKCRSQAICGKTIEVTEFLDLCCEQLVQPAAVEILSTISTSAGKGKSRGKALSSEKQAQLLPTTRPGGERSIIDISSTSESAGSDRGIQDSPVTEAEIEKRQRLELQVIQLEKTVHSLLPQNAPPAFYDSSPYQQNTRMDKARLMVYDISKNEISLSDGSLDSSGHESELDNSPILQRSAVLLQASPQVPVRAQEITIPTYSSVVTSANIGNPDISHVPIRKKRSKYNSQHSTTTTALYVSGMTHIPLKQLRFIHNLSWIDQRILEILVDTNHAERIKNRIGKYSGYVVKSSFDPLTMDSVSGEDDIQPESKEEMLKRNFVLRLATSASLTRSAVTQGHILNWASNRGLGPQLERELGKRGIAPAAHTSITPPTGTMDSDSKNGYQEDCTRGTAVFGNAPVTAGAAKCVSVPQAGSMWLKSG
ncbi:hypothetical protein C7212DRAFT_348828 [Tuber magnatum]|uniref:Uncharacterized protein n=1 Tax=Tuber magnatum TaxID=42249 RepID=A0A317SDN1_9PEZI|nr:hypothetical protein C7212DRAFT_348828 [Tuber magnatum]